MEENPGGHRQRCGSEEREHQHSPSLQRRHQEHQSVSEPRGGQADQGHVACLRAHLGEHPAQRHPAEGRARPGQAGAAQAQRGTPDQEDAPPQRRPGPPTLPRHQRGPPSARAAQGGRHDIPKEGALSVPGGVQHGNCDWLSCFGPTHRGLAMNLFQLFVFFLILLIYCFI